MSEPEVKFEIDEHGRIGYRVTNEGVLLSKDEKEFIIDHVTRMQAENAKLRELLREVIDDAWEKDYYMPSYWLDKELRELGIEVD